MKIDSAWTDLSRLGEPKPPFRNMMNRQFIMLPVRLSGTPIPRGTGQTPSGAA
ncbi:hypothetical protein PV721_09635 [Streptomyces sp. MB09-01]|uniref:hypothetical protein n=1 Tax=Streptomyces sp. MB09-01 TaxID=3028666 RepID=UPI0029B110E2|nr:hypothetical protein [Streptomyces sp. MB09-01]MDX3534626.1 hypothetical protein [Streptomyces sp. MB09-01]